MRKTSAKHGDSLMKNNLPTSQPALNDKQYNSELKIIPLSPQKKAQQISVFIDFFVKEFVAEVNHLQEVARGNQQHREQSNAMKTLVKIIGVFADMLPIPGLEIICDGLELLLETKDTHDREQEIQQKLQALHKLQIDDRLDQVDLVLDVHVTTVWATVLAEGLAWRYQELLLERLNTHPEEGLIVFARSLARNCIGEIIHRSFSSLPPTAPTFMQKRNACLSGAIIKHERNWFSRNVLCQTLAITPRASLSDVTVESMLTHGGFAVDDGKTVTHYTHQDSNIHTFSDDTQNRFLKYGAAYVDELSDVPSTYRSHSKWTEIKSNSLLYQAIDLVHRRRYIRKVSAQDISNYLDSENVQNAKKRKETCQESFNTYHCRTLGYADAADCQFICYEDLQDLDVSFANFTGMHFMAAQFKGDMSGTNFTNVVAIGAIFNAVITPHAPAVFEAADLSLCQFHQAQLRRANCRNSTLILTDFYGADLSEIDYLGAALYKLRLDDVTRHHLTAQQLTDFEGELNRQATALDTADTKIIALTQRIDTLEEKMAMVGEEQYMLLVRQADCLRYQRYCEQQLQQLHQQQAGNQVEMHRLALEQARVQGVIQALESRLTTVEIKITDFAFQQQQREKISTMEKRYEAPLVAWCTLLRRDLCVPATLHGTTAVLAYLREHYALDMQSIGQSGEHKDSPSHRQALSHEFIEHLSTAWQRIQNYKQRLLRDETPTAADAVWLERMSEVLLEAKADYESKDEKQKGYLRHENYYGFNPLLDTQTKVRVAFLDDAKKKRVATGMDKLHYYARIQAFLNEPLATCKHFLLTELPEAYVGHYIDWLCEERQAFAFKDTKVWRDDLTHAARQDGWSYGLARQRQQWQTTQDTIWSSPSETKTLDTTANPNTWTLMDLLNNKTYSLPDNYYQQLFNDEQLKPKPAGQSGRHLVLPLDTPEGRVYLKFYPEQPGLELALHAFDQRLTGGTTAPIGFIALKRPGEASPLLASVTPAIEGADICSLAYTVKHHPERLARIDKASFTATLFVYYSLILKTIRVMIIF